MQLQPQVACLGVGTSQLARAVLGHLLDALPQAELPRLRLGEQLRRAAVRRLVFRHLAPHLVAQIDRLDGWRMEMEMEMEMKMGDGDENRGAPYRCKCVYTCRPALLSLSICPSGASSSPLPPPTSSSFFSAWLYSAQAAGARAKVRASARIVARVQSEGWCGKSWVAEAPR